VRKALGLCPTSVAQPVSRMVLDGVVMSKDDLDVARTGLATAVEGNRGVAAANPEEDMDLSVDLSGEEFGLKHAQ
jgi:hypothetical protein